MSRIIAYVAGAVLAAGAARAGGTVNGGGEQTPGALLNVQKTRFNAGSPPAGRVPGPPPAQFGMYFPGGSVPGWIGLLEDNLTCVMDAQNGMPGCQASGPPQDYAVSGIPLASDQTAQWSQVPTGQALSGNLIQFPALGLGVAIAVNNAAVTQDGQATLSDGDLCGVFSGLITDFSQITDAGIALRPGPITVVYRQDAGDTSYLLTNHLADGSVCNGGNTRPGFVFRPTASFGSLFGGAPPPNFVPEFTSAGIANAMSGLGNLPPPQAASSIGYLTPDWTKVDAATALARLSNGMASQLPAAAIRSLGGVPALPTVGAIGTGLTHPLDGTDLQPPAPANAANPLLWSPTIATVSSGYPIVGYDLWDTAQCTADPNIASAMTQFVADILIQKHSRGEDARNGFVQVPNYNQYVTMIFAELLSPGAATGIENASVCKAVGGSTYPGR